MNNNLQYPSIDAVKSVLLKLNIDPATRDLDCQDYEYTTCRLEEIDKYINLYKNRDTTVYEKRLLGCYLLECLNEHVSLNNNEHTLQHEAFELLHSDIDIHGTELKYWSNIENKSKEEQWPISEYLFKWQHT